MSHLQINLDLPENSCLAQFRAPMRTPIETLRLTPHQREILTTLREFGPGSKDFISSRCSLTGAQIDRALPELLRKGYASPTGKKARSTAGRPEREWKANV